MTLSNFWLWRTSSQKYRYLYQRVVIYLNIYISIHALYVLTIESLFPEIRYLDKLPFSLLYGPFFCFIILAQKNDKVSKSTIAIHIMPFCFLFLCYIAIWFQGIPSELVLSYSRALGICSLLSFSGYAGWSIHYVTHLKHKPFIKRPLLLIGFMLLVLMSLIVLAYLLSDGKISAVDSARTLLRSLVYSCMFGATYLMNSDLRHKKKLIDSKIENQKQVLESKYEKSLLPQERLDAYANALNDIMSHDKVYLHHDLSLQKLADLINIPHHHLTQVFNLKLGTTFHKYVNNLRIKDACDLLLAQKHIPIEIIAQRCGFNSKSSFNRNFKASQGCSPSEYRSSQE